jgi:hypothetical protein
LPNISVPWFLVAIYVCSTAQKQSLEFLHEACS